MASNQVRLLGKLLKATRALSKKTRDKYVDKRSKKFEHLGLLIVLLVCCVLLSFLSPVFLTKTNLINLLLQSSMLLTLALGMTFVILTGGIDLSVTGIMAVSSAIGIGMILNHDLPVIWGTWICIGIGMLFGLFNGWIISRLMVPPIIVTLATMGLCKGILLIYTKGKHITPVPRSYVILANERIFGIPILLVIVGVMAVIFHIVLKYTKFGRSVYATGGNLLAARLSGIKTGLVITTVYVLSGVSAAIAGILMAGIFQSASPNIDIGMVLTVITAVVIGGTSLFGGQGSIIGVVLGVFLICIISNAVNLMAVPPAWDNLVTSFAILAAALFDVYRRRSDEV